MSNKGQLQEAAEQYRIAQQLAPAEPLPAQNLSSTLFSLGQYDEAMKFADIALSLRPAGGTAISRWYRAHLQFDPRETAFKEVAAKYASRDAVLQVEMSLALWDGRMADYLASYRKLIEFYRLVQPAGPGWREVRAAAGAGSTPDHLTESLLGWVLGCAFVYAALFGAGSFLYGKTAQGLLWSLIFIISLFGLSRVLPRIWSSSHG